MEFPRSLFFLAVALLHGGPIAGAAPALVLLNGTEVEGEVLTIAAGQVALRGADTTYPLRDLRSLNLDADKGPASTPRKVRIDLHGGGTVYANSVRLADDRLHAEWAFETPLELPIEAVRSIDFRASRKDGVQPRARRDADRIYVQVGGEVQAVEGLVLGIADGLLKMEWKDEPRTLDLDQVAALALAELGAEAEGLAYIAQLTDGSALPCADLALDGETLTLRGAAGVEIALPRGLLDGVRVRSDKLVFLSGLEPLEFVNEPLLAPRRSWQADRSVTGGPIRLDGRVYRRGIGMAAGHRLTFPAPEGFTRFHAVIGIDDDTRGRGDCVFVLRAGEREVLRRRMRGGEPPVPVQVDLDGARRLVLEIERGEDLDLADHADWAEAYLLQE